MQAIGWRLLLLLLTGCSPLRYYHPEAEPCQAAAQALQSCATSAIQQRQLSPDLYYSLSFIEFDDQGQLWQRAQLHRLQTYLAQQSGQQSLLMLVFVHGWKHSAQAEDLHIATFNRILAQIAQDEAKVAKAEQRPARQVAGIYLGWRGGSVRLPVIREASFWERKNTAQKVAHGGVAEVLNRLEQLRLAQNAHQPNASAPTQLAIIGHSFGGAILYSALAQILEQRFIEAAGHCRTEPKASLPPIQGFANLVVLINPAFEAVKFSTLHAMAAECRHYSPQQLPVLAILSSRADWATRVAFKAGRLVSTLFERTTQPSHYNAVLERQQTIDQHQANITAIGHFKPYQTHQLTPAVSTTGGPVGLMPQLDALRHDWQQDAPGKTLRIADLNLTRSTDSAGRNPYMLIAADPQLIADHGDISQPAILNFMRQLILLAMRLGQD